MRPALGVMVRPNGSYAAAQLCCRGRVANQWDGKTRTPLELKRIPMAKLGCDSVRPWENGTPNDTHWPQITGTAMHTPASTPGRAPLLPFAAANPTNLTPAGFWTVQIDKRQMGVGGDNSWSPKAMPLPKYRLESFGKRLEFEVEFCWRYMMTT